jgi:uncharacterized protein (TIGR00106 family)
MQVPGPLSPINRTSPLKEITMLAEFSVLPADHERMSEHVATAISVLDESGLKYRLGPMSTSIEGDLDDILDVVARCHRAVADRNNSRVITTIILDEHRGAAQSLEEAIRSVEEHLSSAPVH